LSIGCGARTLGWCVRGEDLAGVGVLACLAVVASALSGCSGPPRGVVEALGAGDGRDGSRGRGMGQWHTQAPPGRHGGAKSC
jgi:hypothetical protein